MIGDRGGTSIGGKGTDGEEDEVGDGVRGLEIEEGDGVGCWESGFEREGVMLGEVEVDGGDGPQISVETKANADYSGPDERKMEAGGLWPVGILDIKELLQWDKMISTWNVEDDEQLQERGAPFGDAIEEEKWTG
ncbi:hypothetical protein F0562_007426 [Nyssa sinensis]|uniref:Uncharacterized protein n=1 Tax=Nyssa sinensis TaxID=561372 RepID=A0A5J5A816_9ASTE|nr:hypothetical protein F0562_007426 [Nyssa sinensis]